MDAKAKSQKKATHTPGPWKWDNNTEKVWGAKKVEICKVAYMHMENDEREANARLISAAPDMLTALRLISAAASVLVNIDLQWRSLRMIVDEAIAKAEGRE